jgi:co-chaperonin GroES (HSP10)
VTPALVRPRRDFVLVLADQRKTQLDSGLFLPVETGAEKVTEGAGTVIRLGPGEKNEKVGLAPGDRIVYRSFLKHANPVENDERWPGGEKKEYFLMSIDDIMGIADASVSVGVYSSPAHRGAVEVDQDTGAVKELR